MSLLKYFSYQTKNNHSFSSNLSVVLPTSVPLLSSAELEAANVHVGKVLTATTASCGKYNWCIPEERAAIGNATTLPFCMNKLHAVDIQHGMWSTMLPDLITAITYGSETFSSSFYSLIQQVSTHLYIYGVHGYSCQIQKIYWSMWSSTLA